MAHASCATSRPRGSTSIDEDRLRDILRNGRAAIELAERGVAAIQADYLLELALRQALFIIGEAAGQLSAAARRDVPQPWAKISIPQLVKTARESVPGLVAVEAFLVPR